MQGSRGSDAAFCNAAASQPHLAAETATAPDSRTPTRTPQPEPVYIRARELPVNCRFGPGKIYDVISTLQAGQAARVDGRDDSGGWLHIHDPLNPGGFCWLSTVPVDVEGDSATLPVVSPPYVTVKKVDVRVEPQRVTTTCENFPQYALFIGEVTVDGPALVNWRWEMSTGEVSEPQA